MTDRFLAYLILLVSFFLLPWWLTAIVAFVSAFFLPVFYEGAIFVAVSLLVYTSTGSLWFFVWGFGYVALVVLLDHFIKPRLSWYDR